MAVIDDLTAAKAQVAANLKAITLAPKPSYSIDGENVSWSELFASYTEQLANLNRLIQEEGGPFSIATKMST